MFKVTHNSKLFIIKSQPYLIVTHNSKFTHILQSHPQFTSRERTQIKTYRHIHKHIKSIARPDLLAGPGENKVQGHPVFKNHP